MFFKNSFSRDWGGGRQPSCNPRPEKQPVLANAGEVILKEENSEEMPAVVEGKFAKSKSSIRL